MTGEASEKGIEIARKAIDFASVPHEKTVFIYGGETTVTIKGNGKGGRNQEIALAAAFELRNQKDILIFSLGSDGTDGPTDAAGGMSDGQSYENALIKGNAIGALMVTSKGDNSSLPTEEELEAFIMSHERVAM